MVASSAPSRRNCSAIFLYLPLYSISVPQTSWLLGGDDFDFHEAVLRETGNFHAGTGGFVIAEEISIKLVHDAEIRHIRQENQGFDDVGAFKSRFFQDSVYIGQRLGSLCLNAVRQRSSFGIQAQLAGGEEHVSGLYRLGIWADGRGSLCGADNCGCHIDPPDGRGLPEIMSVLWYNSPDPGRVPARP